jgi:glucose-1-phosphate cytidylyltransferase
MKIFSSYGYNDFIICLGYKGYMIKEYFANYGLHMSDVTIDIRERTTKVHQDNAEPWRVTLVDTGLRTMTGGRLRRVREYLDDSDFFFTYGDGVGSIDLRRLLAHHREAGCLATVTAVQPPGRFGTLEFTGDHVSSFVEKPRGDGGWINGGFFVLNPKVIDHISSDETVWEQQPLRELAAKRQLVAYRHDGFWYPMDTLRDKYHLENLWNSGSPPWKMW